MQEARQIVLITADAEWEGKLQGLLRAHGELRTFADGAEALEAIRRAGDEGRSALVVLDEGVPGGNAFSLCRRLRAAGRHRIAMLLRSPAAVAGPIATFCGAGIAVAFPSGLQELADELESQSVQVPVDELLRRGESEGEASIREGVLRDLAHMSTGGGLLDSITDPETKLFSYPFLLFKLDEEYKRASRFKFPLACVMFGFEGEANEQVLLELAGIFLNESRDTDVLGRFDLNSFLFLLPNTGPDGAEAMARRVLEAASARPLHDLAGDRLQVSVGLSTYPHEAITRREHLFERTREAFFAARNRGGGLVVAP